MLQNAPPLRRSAPGPPNISDEHVFCTAPATQMHLSRSSSNAPRLPSFLEIPQNPHVLLTFGKVQDPLHLPRKTTSEPSKAVRACGAFNILTWNVLRATMACTFSTSQLQKVLGSGCALYILTSKCASRHNAMHFFDMSNTKSGPNLVCFAHFDFNVLRATTARTFLTSQLPKVVRTWCALYILTSKCASRHNAVHFFDMSNTKSGPNLVCFAHFDFNVASRHNGAHFFDISTSKSGPNMVCFVHFDFEMCFAPQRRASFHLSSGQMAPHPPL